MNQSQLCSHPKGFFLFFLAGRGFHVLTFWNLQSYLSTWSPRADIFQAPLSQWSRIPKLPIKNFEDSKFFELQRSGILNGMLLVITSIALMPESYELGKVAEGKWIPFPSGTKAVNFGLQRRKHFSRTRRKVLGRDQCISNSLGMPSSITSSPC